MLFNLKTEIARAKTSQAKIARAIGIRTETISDKILEKSDFTRSEMYAIHDRFFPNVDFRYLFTSDKEKRE